MPGKHRLPSGNAGLPDVSYYDFALAILPVPLLVGFLLGELLAISSGVGVSAGAAVSALVVGYLLFGSPPMRPDRRTHDDPARRGPREGFDGPSA